MTPKESQTIEKPGVETAVEKSRAMRRRTKAWLWGIGLSLYVAAIWLIGWNAIRDALSSLRLWPLAGMTLMTFAALWLRALKWRIALGPGVQAVSAYFLSKLAGEWSPGRIGEFAPLFVKRHRNARMAAWIVVDRLLEATTTLGFGMAGLALLRIPNRGAMAVAGALIGLILLVAVYALTQGKLLRRLAARRNAQGRLARLGSALAQVSDEAVRFRSTAPWTVAISVLAGAMDVWVGMLSLLAFGAGIPFSLVAVGKVVHIATATLPFAPNATGAPYLATATLIHEVGGVPSGVLAAQVGVSVIITNVVFWASMGIAAWLFALKQKNAKG